MSRSERRVLTIAVLASFVSFLDGSIVNVALPAIAAELGGGLVTQQWVVDAYFITLGALILLAGSLSDAFGRVLVLRIGLIGFGVTSLAITVAPDPIVLIVARALQGAAGAFLVPSSLALIMSAFEGPARSRAVGIWTALTTGAMVAGPLIGGALVDLASWRLAFLINVPIIVLTLLLLRTLRDPERLPDARVDWLGAMLCTLGLGGLVFALIEQPNWGWQSPITAGPFVAGGIMFGLFLARQRVAAAPLLPLELFRVRNFWVGNIATFLVYAALSLNGFVLAVYLQQGAGLSATLAGLASLPTTVILILLSSRVGALAGRWGPRAFMAVGPLVMAVGSLLLLSVRHEFNYWWQVFPGMVLFGLGLAIMVSPLTAAIVGAIETDRSGIASAVNNAVSRVAGLLAVAALGTIAGGTLDLIGFQRAIIATAVLMAAGGLISLAGIRNRSADVPTGE